VDVVYQLGGYKLCTNLLSSCFSSKLNCSFGFMLKRHAGRCEWHNHRAVVTAQGRPKRGKPWRVFRQAATVVNDDEYVSDFAEDFVTVLRV
jgi:hypothetical protein